jgi:hypothetical protein
MTNGTKLLEGISGEGELVPLANTVEAKDGDGRVIFLQVGRVVVRRKEHSIRGARPGKLFFCLPACCIQTYFLGAPVQGPDGGIKRVDSIANVVGEGWDLISEDNPGQGRLDKVAEVCHARCYCCPTKCAKVAMRRRKR